MAQSNKAERRRGVLDRLPRVPVLALFALIALSLIGGVVLIVGTIGAERTERSEAARTAEVMTLLRDINRAAVNGETGQRGYYITLDRRYLAPYTSARAQIEPLIDGLAQRSGEFRQLRQQQLAAEVAQLARAKFAELDETIELMSAGNVQEVQRRILTDEGQDVMERLRRAVTEMEAIERTELENARADAVANENRVIPLLLSLLGLILAALALGLWQVFRTAEAEAQAAQASALAEARDRADLLAKEMSHRVKNLFAVILAIVRMSARDTPEARPAIERIAGRIEALLKAHEVTQGSSYHRVARLDELVETTLAPYRTDRARATITGEQVNLPERHVVPLGLVLHELATNAVKYGAWSQDGGEIKVSWSALPDAPDTLVLRWREHCTFPCATEAARKGFGSMLIDGSARQLSGTYERTFHPDGIELTMEFPLGS